MGHAWTQIEPQTRGQYVNLAATDDREVRVHAAYGESYPRLAALKKRYDPGNLLPVMLHAWTTRESAARR